MKTLCDTAPQTGMVFDIQRGSFHDGPGLRTTVFLKGCPLRCAWCHNPESQKCQVELSFRASRCVGCQRCAKACAHGCHSFEGKQHVIDRRNCVGCGECVAGCPADALSLFGRRMSAPEVLQEVVLDEVFYKNSGGGLTLSGGEPTLQIEFCLELLKAARERGIHTCVETCGISPQGHYEKLLPWVDLFLFDYKITDAEKHRQFTGVGNEVILERLRFLHQAGAAILLRCPILPGINDDSGHFEGIARLVAELPRLKGVELLPYHEAGMDKYLRVGRERPVLPIHAPTAAESAIWTEELFRRGCHKAVLVA